MRLKIQRSSNPESVYYLYIVDDFENLVGVISLRNLLRVDSARRLRDFMIADVIRVNVYDNQSVAARAIEVYRLVSLPVVDEQGRLAGVVMVDDVIDYLKMRRRTKFCK